MFARLAALAVLTLPALVAAQSCNTGAIQCCNTVQWATDPQASAILGLIDVVIDDLDVLVGINCSPISVIGVGGGTSCDSHPVCCENNSFGSLISIGCVPVVV
ncbi:fungal hydrophobin [Trametes coccinea BRFM310]|uniref:Hydrophobin n=1 Tax=Trametes coccinea (strain BRFM310) TaxID=1353009 RepID=A0A1Y2ILZ3_TRAC3|nr:fungal hydrophobin [Trametes coccinea BRFM310]